MSIKLKGPDNNNGFTHGSFSYKPDKNGVVEVHPDHVDAARSHGFHPLPEPVKKAVAKQDDDE